MLLEARYAGLIQQGITIRGTPVGGLDPVKAARKLETALPTRAEGILVLEDTGKNHLINLSEIDGAYDYASTAWKARGYGGEAGLNRLIAILRLRALPIDLPIGIVFSEEKLADRIRLIKKERDEPPINASVGFFDGKVTIVPEKIGYNLDFEETLKQSLLALSAGYLHTTVAGRIFQPEITSADLEGIDSQLAEYTTTFDNGDRNRSHNIELASAALNGSLLKPGEVFSLNQQLGPRLADKGYLKAPVFMGSQLSQDVGGGVCQVATTLYNAVLLAGLAVTERFPHPRPVGYASPGRDATIAGDYLDLKFTNNTDKNIYIASQVEAGMLTVRIFGSRKTNNRVVRIHTEKNNIEPKVVVIRDDAVPEGESIIINPGRPGYEVRVYREIEVNGRLESRTLISKDYYKPVDRIIHISPKREGIDK